MIADSLPANVARASCPCGAEDTGRMPVPRTTREKCGLNAEKVPDVEKVPRTVSPREAKKTTVADACSTMLATSYWQFLENMFSRRALRAQPRRGATR